MSDALPPGTVAVPAPLRHADPALRRLEEISLNASATPRQLLYDGWLVRMSPGKAKRARSINPFFPSTLPLDEKLARCAELYQARGLPMIVRVTPFVQPAELDDQLAARGFTAFEETRVMTAELDAAIAAGPRDDGDDDRRHVAVEACDLDTLVAVVSALRGTGEREMIAHAERLRALPLAARGFLIKDRGAAVCAGVAVLEPPWVGLFDVITAEMHRGRGLASHLTRAMLSWSRIGDAERAYLQVDATNTAARTVYARSGFVDRYAYWYRQAPATSPR